MSEPQVSGCALCATLGKTCCQMREVLVTAGDIARIGRFTGRSGFWEYIRPFEPSYLDQPDDPNWLRWAFRPDGTRPILKRGPDGDCPFLGPRGCSLPIEVRPLVCRLFPYEYTQAGLAGVSSECPPPVIPPGSDILRVLDIRLSDALRWHNMLYAELRTKEPCDESRPDVRLAG